MNRQVPWLRVFVEGGEIVSSILLALAADAWWEDRQERQQGRDALEHLAAEFAAVDSILALWHANHQDVLVASEVLLRYTGPAPAAALPGDSTGALIWRSILAPTVDPPTATLSSLESSGRLGVIQNQEILTRLAAWKSGLGDLEESEGIMVRYAYEVLQPYINSHAAYRSISSYSRDGVFAGAPSAFPDGLLELLTDREFEGGKSGFLVVITALEEVEAIASDQVNKAVFLGDATRPHVRSKVFEGLRLADSAEGVASNRFDEVHDLEGNSTIRVNPEAEVFSEFDLKEDPPIRASLPTQGRIRPSATRVNGARLRSRARSGGHGGDVERSWATGGGGQTLPDSSIRRQESTPCLHGRVE